MPVERWNSGKIVKAAGAEMHKRMLRAVLVVEGDVKQRIGRGQPVERDASGNLRGLDPSRPGEPPKVVTSRLRTSITHAVERTATAIIGRIGSNVPHARRLELGFFGADKKGRNINQAARPYLRPSLKERLSQVIRILGGA